MDSLPNSFRFGEFDLDVQLAQLRRSGNRVALQEQPFQLLLLLVQRPGEVVTRDDLRLRLWPADTFVDFDQGLNAAVRRLRQALNDSAENPRFIETVPRHGYRFIAPVDTTLAPDGQRSQSPSHPAEMPSRQRAAHLWWKVSAAVGCLALLALVFGRDARDRLWPREVRPRITGIAVLPLENLTGDPALEYAADWLTESLTTDLARLMPLKVVSRTSAMTYKGQRKPVGVIARELGVDGVVEGAFARSGPRLRITVQLVCAAADRHLWAESFDREASDLASLSEEVARAVGREIGVKLPVTPSSRRRPIDPEAARLYVEGRYFYGRWPDGLDRAIERFKKACALDPSFAAAAGSLAMCEVDRSFRQPPARALEQGRQLALRALANEDVATAHAALGGVKMFREWDWSGAENALRRAIALDPSSSEIRIWYANLLTAVGRHDEALTEAIRARERDPVSILASANVGWTLLRARRYEAALAEFRRALELDRSFPLVHNELAWCYAAQNRFAEAFAELDRAGRNPRDPFLGLLYGLSGRRDEGLRIARTLEQQAKTDYVSPLDIAVVHLGAGNRDLALRWLERALDERSSNLFLLKVDSAWDGLRDHPRFQACLRRMALAP